MTTCGTCGRDLASRECSDPQHRAARGFTEETAQRLAGTRTCIKCHKTKPFPDFWARTTQRQSARGRAYQTCNQCRYLARKKRRSHFQAQERERVREAEKFWQEQAAAHI